MNSKRVGIVMGGTSAEREISLRSGQAVGKALQLAGHHVVRIDLGAGRDPVEQLRKAEIEAAFLALQGRLGEDGCIQGTLELLGIPYTGSGVLESALAMDKLKSKELFRLHNVPTPPYYVYSAEATSDLILETHGSFGYPAMVKPRRAGSRLGVGCAKDSNGLVAAIRTATEYDRDVLVERFVCGKEITVGILNGRVLGALEVAPSNGIHDHAVKQTPAPGDCHVPARLPPTLYKNVLFLAEHAAQALGVSGAVQVDLMVTESQNEYVLEVNSLPAMTPSSLLPQIAAAAGYGFPDLCEALLASARLHVHGARPVQQAPVVALNQATERQLRVAAGSEGSPRPKWAARPFTASSRRHSVPPAWEPSLWPDASPR